MNHNTPTLHNLKTLLKLTAITTPFIHLYNFILIQQASTHSKLARATNKHYHNTNTTSIFYTKHGTGSPILLIHDLTPGSSGYEWNRIEKELSKTHTVYTIDLPGCGRSEKRRQTYTNYFYTQALSDFIETVIGDKTDIIASGYSTSLAITLTKYSAETINKVILINPNNPKRYTRQASEKEKIFHNILLIPIFGTLIYHMVVSRENIDYLFVENYYYNPFHLDTDMEDAYYEAAHKGNSLSKYLYASLIRNDIGCNVGNALKRINNNIKLIFGESEPNCYEISKQYQDFNTTISTTIIDQAKHFPHIEQPQEFIDQVNSFLENE